MNKVSVNPTIVNYKVDFHLKKNQRIDLVKCFSLLQENGVLCGLDLDSQKIKALKVLFEELNFRLFSSGKALLYIKNEQELIGCKKVLFNFYLSYVEVCVVLENKKQYC